MAKTAAAWFSYMEQMSLDNDLLIGTIEYEEALLRLDRPVKEPPEYPEEVPSIDEDGNPIMIPNPDIVLDQQERANAQIIIDNVTTEELALYELRNPIIEVIEDIEE